MPNKKLRPDWYQETKVDGVDPTQPGLYEWNIEKIGFYIGKYKKVSRPRHEYRRNVMRLENGLNYHIRGRDFRPIHRALWEAYRDNRKITLTLLENELDDLKRNERERELILEGRIRAEREGLLLLNSR